MSRNFSDAKIGWRAYAFDIWDLAGGPKALSRSVYFSSMPYFYDKDGEDIFFDLVEYPVIPYPDPVSFSVFPLE